MQCILAHDIMNGLAIILGECELLAASSPGDVDAARRLAVVAHTARQLACTVRQLSCPAGAMGQAATASQSEPAGQPVSVDAA